MARRQLEKLSPEQVAFVAQRMVKVVAVPGEGDDVACAWCGDPLPGIGIGVAPLYETEPMCSIDCVVADTLVCWEPARGA